MFGWLIGIGEWAAPYAYGWISNELFGWFDSSDPVESKSDSYGLAGWGLSTVLLLVIGIFSYEKWLK